ncbi:OsmC family protein [Luteolibacter sp. GHJ8]|jgi:osmotically inducible protein OsmC|uniref:OsmC family protein n=1 Tax=Luteolibacter rhizosphaerae TaxID=2989719 RepID=A0ABT3G9Y2_9BACT|nr:OsmC family protein [Luteolibacter rhizosphaerae]MCW1916654.1 OsmC family protein [Luteolibacter rhizosphaerae]
MHRHATARWTGNLQAGSGVLDTQSAVLFGTPYSFRSRFGDGKETNPEELLAAAHAGCFTMAVSLFISEQGFTPEVLETKADLSFDPAALEITSIHLTLSAKVPGLSRDLFASLTEKAKAGCPVSKVLRAAITLDATLEN